MAIKNVITLILIVVAGIAFWFIWDLEERSQDRLDKMETEEAAGKVLYIINKEEGDIKEYEPEIFDDSTVFSLLEELAEKENFIIETTSYPEMGIFVESIDGLKGGTDNKWWQYWINEKLGEVAADKKEVKTGDVIEWRFEVPPEF
jgi:hypothetical protein